MSFDVAKLRSSFPALNQEINGYPLIYFDNAASTLKHKDVCDRVHHYNLYETANVHRGAHTLSQKGTDHYERARLLVKDFIGASSDEEIIFVRGTTEGVNLVASSFVESFQPGDEILISPFEHHSNIVCWQMICEKKQLKLKVMPFDKEKGLSLETAEKAITEKTKLMSFLWYSNSFGYRLPVEALLKLCKERGIHSFVDAAQAPLHEKMNVQELDCDFLTFSGHKMFAPYGIGVLYGKKSLLEKMPPYQSGGSMIDRVDYDKTRFADLPQKFEAGTPNISAAIGLGEAISQINKSDFSHWHTHIQNLREQLIAGLKDIEGVEVYDFPSEQHTGVVSYNVKGVHSSDIGSLLDKYGIAVRTGHHCTQPLMKEMGLEGTVRASLAPYNTLEEVQVFCEKMKKVKEFF